MLVIEGMNWQKRHPAIADCRQMSAAVLLGCNLEMYRILQEQMCCGLANFYLTVDWSIFLLLRMKAYACLKTICLVMFVGSFAWVPKHCTWQ